MKMHRILTAALASAAVAVLASAGPSTAADLEHGEELYDLCAQCHGTAGGGNQEFMAPPIAGMGEWYVKEQLERFRAGLRGMHPDDVGGLRMYPMALSLRSDEEIADVSAYVASLPAADPEETLVGGDASRGKTLFAPCTACHGADASGNEQLKSGPLRFSSDWYLLSSLEKFKSGLRGGVPGDQTGALMRPMAALLADDQAMKDVIAYIMSLKQ